MLAVCAVRPFLWATHPTGCTCVSVYANYFDDCWLEHCHYHSLPTWRLQLLHDLTLKIKKCKMKQFLHQQLAPTHWQVLAKPSEVHPRLLWPGIHGKCPPPHPPWPWKHAKVGKRSSYQGDISSNEQPAPHQYTSPVRQPSGFLDSIQPWKNNHPPMSS